MDSPKSLRENEPSNLEDILGEKNDDSNNVIKELKDSVPIKLIAAAILTLSRKPSHRQTFF